MKSIETISEEITVLEAERDFGNISPERMELLAVLNLCYDLLTRTRMVQEIRVMGNEEDKDFKVIEEFKEGVAVYGNSTNALADFAFAVATRSGKVDLRALLYQIKCAHTDTAIAEGIGMRRSTISEYMNRKSPFSADGWERIVNFTLSDHGK